MAEVSRGSLLARSFRSEDFPWASPRSVDTLAKRIWARVDFDAPLPCNRPELGPCWVWTGSLFRGYGRVQLTPADGRASRHAPQQVHRLTWTLANGPISDDLEIDHLCRVHGCVRPDHLEPVTTRENALRGDRATRTHCIHGHEYTEANTIRRVNRLGNPGRQCRECRRVYDRSRNAARYRRQKAVRLGG